MATKKISELDVATSAAAADLVPIVQGGTTKQVTVENFVTATNVTTAVAAMSAGQTQSVREDLTPAPVTLIASTSLVHDTHFNRQLIIDQAGATSMTIDNDATTGALPSDVIELTNIGAGTATFVAGTGTLTVGTGFTAAVAPNTTGTLTYVGGNEWVSATPTPSSGAATVSCIAMSTPVTVSANNTKSVTFTIPAGSLGAKGAARVTWVAIKSGAVESVATKVKIGAVGFTFSAGVDMQNLNSGTAVGTYAGESWIHADGTGSLSSAVHSNGAIFTNTSPVTANALSHNHDSTAWEIAIGGNPGATTATWIIKHAIVTIFKPA